MGPAPSIKPPSSQLSGGPRRVTMTRWEPSILPATGLRITEGTIERSWVILRWTLGCIFSDDGKRNPVARTAVEDDQRRLPGEAYGSIPHPTCPRSYAPRMADRSHRG